MPDENVSSGGQSVSGDAPKLTPADLERLAEKVWQFLLRDLRLQRNRARTLRGSRR